MEKLILIAGKDFPDGREFSSTAVLKGNSAVITAPSDSAALREDDGTVVVPWNRSSALSCRSLVLSCLNEGNSIDEAYLIFDEEYYAPKFSVLNGTEIARACDELILGYQYLTSELISRFSQRKTVESACKGKIIFLYKSNFSDYDFILNQNVRKSNSTLSKSLVAAAGAAFKSFAENTAASLTTMTSVNSDEEIIPVLIECDSENEISKKDSTLSSWLFEYTANLDSLKKPLSDKQKVSWVKAGAKSAGGFSLFK